MAFCKPGCGLSKVKGAPIMLIYSGMRRLKVLGPPLPAERPCFMDVVSRIRSGVAPSPRAPLLCACLRSGLLPAARSLFDHMPERDLVSYNSMLPGHAAAGDMAGARLLFGEMPERTLSPGTRCWSGTPALATWRRQGGCSPAAGSDPVERPWRPSKVGDAEASASDATNWSCGRTEAEFWNAAALGGPGLLGLSMDMGHGEFFGVVLVWLEHDAAGEGTVELLRRRKLCLSSLELQIHGKNQLFDAVKLCYLHQLHQHFEVTPDLLLTSSPGYANFTPFHMLEITDSVCWSIEHGAQSLECLNWNRPTDLLLSGDIHLVKQDILSMFGSTRLSLYDDTHGEDVVPVVRVDPSAVDDNVATVVPQIQRRGLLSLSSMKDIQYLQLFTPLPQVHMPDRLSGEPPAGHQLVWSTDAVEDCNCAIFGSELSTDGRSTFGSFSSLLRPRFASSSLHIGLCFVACLYLALLSRTMLYFEL